MKQPQEAPKAVQDCHALILWMVPQLDLFPKSRRYSLGTRIEEGLCFVLEKLVEASYSRARAVNLREANLRLEVLRHLWRVAFELKAIALKAWSIGAELMLGLGRQIGGWLKASGQGDA